MPADGADLCRRVLHARGRPCARRASASGGWSGPGPVPPPRRMRLFFGGDVMQHMPQVDAVRCGDGFDYEPVFRDARAPHQGRRPGRGEPRNHPHAPQPLYGLSAFPSPAALADALRDAGVDVAVLANNHCCDNGAEGIRTSVEELDRCGIRHTGAFADSADYKKNNPLYLTHCGIRLAIVNYTYGTNGMPVPEGTVVNLIDTVRMAADLAAARASGVDFIVACVHWGDEYQRRENAAQRSLAAFLRRHGTDVVVGSHPHVIQPWVADSSHVVLYSLGNLVSGQRRRYTDGGLAGHGGGRPASRGADDLPARNDARVGQCAGLPHPTPGAARHGDAARGLRDFPRRPRRAARETAYR